MKPLVVAVVIVVLGLAWAFYERDFIDYRINGCRCAPARCRRHDAYPRTVRLLPAWMRAKIYDLHIPPPAPRLP